VSREQFEHTLIIMYREGWSIRSLSRYFGTSRNAIRRILRAHERQRNAGHDILTKRLKRASKLDAFEPEMKRILGKYPDITAVRLLEELKEAGFAGGITMLRERLADMRPHKEPVLRFETEAGLQGQMDWSPYTIPFTRTGKSAVQCFSYILGFSRRQYVDFTLRRDFYSLIRRHEDAFQYYQGVPRECLYDNEKTIVLRWEAGKPVFNPAFTSFITHYNCKPVACRPGRPETKGKIEAPFKYVESNLLGGREFEDLEELRRVAQWWLREKADLHVHRTTGKPPLELFEQEHLQPLPAHPYDTAEVALRVCDAEGFVSFETNRYSAPSAYIADILTLKATEHEILIFSPEIDCIARHERLPAGQGKKVENPDHFATKRVRYGLEPVREAFIALGEAAEEFLKGLVEKHPRNCGFHTRYILRMKEHYESGDIYAAIEHALKYRAFDGHAVERILKVKAEPRTLESVRNEQARRDLEKALPRIAQRPLDEYRYLLEKDDEEAGRDPDEDQGPCENLAPDRDGEGP
jgi:transposase